MSLFDNKCMLDFFPIGILYIDGTILSLSEMMKNNENLPLINFAFFFFFIKKKINFAFFLSLIVVIMIIGK